MALIHETGASTAVSPDSRTPAAPPGGEQLGLGQFLVLQLSRPGTIVPSCSGPVGGDACRARRGVERLLASLSRSSVRSRAGISSGVESGFGLPPLQRIVPASLTSSVSAVPWPVRVSRNRSGDLDVLPAAGERDRAAAHHDAGRRADASRRRRRSPRRRGAGRRRPRTAVLVARRRLGAAEEQVALAERATATGRLERRRCRCRARRRRRRPRSARAARRPPPVRAALRRSRARSSAGWPSGSGWTPRCRARARPAVAQDDRRRHHARQPPAGRMAVEAERVEILLAEHVVEVHAGAGDDHAGAEPSRRSPSRPSRRGRAPRCGWSSRAAAGRAGTARRTPGRSSPLEELGRALALCAFHHVDDLPTAAARARRRAAPARERSGSRPPTAAGW